MMARRFVTPLLVIVVALCARGAAAEAPYHYLQPSQIDLTVLLPPPPDLNSKEQRADQEAVAQKVAASSPSQVARAQQAVRNVFFFEPSIGAQFAPPAFPLTSALFANINSDVAQLVNAAKLYFARPRPDGADKQRGSYPSGHAAFAAAAAIVLAQLAPCKRQRIFAQARAFGENRIVLGLHYPSDILAGWTAGTLAVSAMLHDSAYQRDFSAAKAEFARVCPA